jgi:transketolase
VLALTRQNLPAVRRDAGENLCAKGGYRLQAAKAGRQVVLIATGSEVELALNVAETLEGQGIGADVVSMPCTELFDEQPESYRADILPAEALRVSIEAGTTFGWERYTGLDGVRIGLDHFGASAPAEVLFEEFGFTVDKVVPRILEKLAK